MDVLGGKPSAFHANAGGAPRRGTSLSTKGTLAFSIFALYILLTGIAITLLRANLLDAMSELPLQLTTTSRITRLVLIFKIMAENIELRVLS